jgi:hypothetical protein
MPKVRKQTVIALILTIVFAVLYLLWSRMEPGQGDESMPAISDMFSDSLRQQERLLGGRFRLARTAGAEGDLTDQEAEALSQLMTLPYLQGSRPAPEQLSVTVYDAERAYNGLNLFISGHAPEAFAMDMNGNILHKWGIEMEDVWRDAVDSEHTQYWRRVRWYPNGDVLAIFEGIGIIKLDKNSELLWNFRGGCHHEAFVVDNGDIYVLTRRPKMRPRISKQLPILEDKITVLDPDGRLIEEYSILESFEKSKFRHLLKTIRKPGDIFHTNSIYVFDGSMAGISPLFGKGHVLISVLKLDALAIINLDREEVVWAESGTPAKMWARQHDPILLPSGNFLLFDNRSAGGGSRVVEFEPFTLKELWQYPDGEDRLYSKTCGTSKRLPNGNTLITESDNGRAIEVTHDKKIVWEYLNPNRAGENNELIATLFELVRVDEDYFQWLDADTRAESNE